MDIFYGNPDDSVQEASDTFLITIQYPQTRVKAIVL